MSACPTPRAPRTDRSRYRDPPCPARRFSLLLFENGMPPPTDPSSSASTLVIASHVREPAGNFLERRVARPFGSTSHNNSLDKEFRQSDGTDSLPCRFEIGFVRGSSRAGF